MVSPPRPRVSTDALVRRPSVLNCVNESRPDPGPDRMIEAHDGEAENNPDGKEIRTTFESEFSIGFGVSN